MNSQITKIGAEAVQWVEWAIRWMENNPESSDMTRAIQEYEAEQKQKSVPLHRQCALLATEWDAVIQEYNAQCSSLQEELPMPVSHPKLTRQNAFEEYAIPAKVDLVRQTAK
jgi:hypothetical protein